MFLHAEFYSQVILHPRPRLGNIDIVRAQPDKPTPLARRTTTNIANQEQDCDEVDKCFG